MASQVVAVIEAFTVIAGAVVFLRLFTRISVNKNVGFEDGCILTAMACSIGLTVAISEQVRNGLGKRFSTLSSKEMINSQKSFWFSIWLYNLALTFTKIGVLVQYLRFFPTYQFRVWCSILLGIVVGYGVWTFFGSIFLCTPVEFFWNKSIDGGSCLNQLVVFYLNAVVNILTDMAIIFLPVPALRFLNIPISHRRALLAIFGLGGLVCLISIIRLGTLARIANSDDPTLHNPPAATLSAIEVNLGILCACLPALRPLLAHMMPTYFPTIPQPGTLYTKDVEQPQTATYVSHTQTNTAGGTTRPSYSRGESNTLYSGNDTELQDMYQASVFGHGNRVLGPVKQVTIGTPPDGSPFTPNAPSLPTLPENLATMGSITRPNSPRSRSAAHSRAQSRAGRPNHSRSSSTHKPLPVTPFPVIDPWNR